jgi:O-antigen/teichoic acid export membrane protein
VSIKKNTLWNLGGSFVPLIVGIAVIPYIYKHLGIERTGILTIIWALIGYFSIFDFGLGRAITQRISNLATLKEQKQKQTIATTGVLLTLIIGIGGGLIGYIAIKLMGVEWLNFETNLDSEITDAFILACLAIPATTATAGLRGVLEGELRFKSINLLKMLLGLSNFMCPVVSIFLNEHRLDSLVASLVAARYLVLIAHYIIVKDLIGRINNNLSREEASKLFKFGGWITLSNLISPLMVVADRLVIANLLGATVLAYYTIPVDFMLRLLLIPSAITASVFPVISKDFASKNLSKIFNLYKKILKYIIVLMGAVILFIIYYADLGLTLWLGNEYAANSLPIVYIIAIGIFINSIGQIPYTFIQASGDARSTTLINIYVLIIYIPMSIILINQFGINGAATAWTIRVIFDLAALHYRALKIFKYY